MTVFLNYFLPFLLSLLCFVLAGIFPNDSKVHEGLLGGAVFMMGVAVPQIANWASRRKADGQAGHGSPITFMVTASVGIIALLAVAFSAGCHNVKPDQFFEATVDCAKVNPDSSAALGAVTTCLVSAVAGNHAACLSGLVTEAKFTVTEVACVVAWVAEQENKKVAISADGPASLEVRNRAIGWMVEKRISVQNTYPGPQ